MKKLVLVCFILSLDLVLSQHDSSSTEAEEVESTNDLNADNVFESMNSSDCWMMLNSPELFKIMDELDGRYLKARTKAQASVDKNKINQKMLEAFIDTKGAAFREYSKNDYQPYMFPSGINLGGYTMLKLKESVLFFHRMKLRNNTYFRVDHLENNLKDMELNVHLSMNDLHLLGAYERSLTDRDSYVLIYAPTFGEVELLLKNVRYKMKARYRLQEKRLTIELISYSEIFMDTALMSYKNQLNDQQVTKMDQTYLRSFLSKLKVDFDKWLKDYFNDHLIRMNLEEIDNIEDLQNYDREKRIALEEYADEAIETIRTRIRQLEASTIRSPTFTFKTVQGMHLQMYDGMLHGLDTIYRRSVPTEVFDQGIRKIDCIVGFSNLKVVHKYEAIIPIHGVPPLSGSMILSANDLAAHLSLSVVINPESIDIDIEYLDTMKAESLTVEGPANMMISSFRDVLENQIASVMSNTLTYSGSMIRSLPRCVPYLPGKPGVIATTRKKSQEEILYSSNEKLKQKGMKRRPIRRPVK